MEARKNTLKLVFPVQAKVPGYLDVLRFVSRDLQLPASMVHSIYKDEDERTFYLKFADRETFNMFFERMDEQYTFRYADGLIARVRFEEANRQVRYIRIFNAHPETEDKVIAAVMSKFGKVRQHVRERYPASFDYPVFTGVRGVHMELHKEIPANLYIGHKRVRIYYDGLRNRCFFCKAEGHIKVNCPKLFGFRGSEPLGDQQSNEQQQQSSEQQAEGGKQLYSQIVDGTPEIGREVEDPLQQSFPPEDWNTMFDDVQSPTTPPSNAQNQESGDKLREVAASSTDAECGKQRNNIEDGANRSTIENRTLSDITDEGSSGTQDNEAGRKTSTTVLSTPNSTNKRPGEELKEDDDGFTLVVKGKKKTPLEAIRDRSRSLNRKARK